MMLDLIDGLERQFMKWPVGYILIIVIGLTWFGSKKANEIQR